VGIFVVLARCGPKNCKRSPHSQCNHYSGDVVYCAL